MNLTNTLKKSKDLQKILLPATQAETNLNLVQETKKMLLNFFKSIDNSRYTSEVENIDIKEIKAYSKLCDILNSFVKVTEEHIQLDENDFKATENK